jgi:hypothetical protein
MAQRKFSIVCLVFGILNILVALVPPCVNSLGVAYMFAEPPVPVRNVDIAPPVWRHLKQELPAYRAEVVGSALCDGFLSLVLMAAAVGLFLNQDWGRWLSIGAALLMVLTFCIHDFYQLAVVRPSVLAVVARTLPPGQPGEAEGNQIGFVMVWFFWCWVNPFIAIYLLGMALTLGLTRVFRKSADVKPPNDEPASDRDRGRDRDSEPRRDRDRPRRYYEHDDD